jgi:hypothetical protein
MALDQVSDPLRTDTSYSGNCNMSWFTRYGGTFPVYVENLGGVYNDYKFCTNGHVVEVTALK